MFEITQETLQSSKILTKDALEFLSKFTTAFEKRRKQLLKRREISLSAQRYVEQNI